MHRDLGGESTRLMIGSAIAVHRELGPGLEEPVYERAFRAQLIAEGIPHSYQQPLPLIYKGIKLDSGYRMDVVVGHSLVVELKSVETVLPVHEAQLLTYLRLAGIELGLLLNFDVATLKEGIRRRALSSSWDAPSTASRELESDAFDSLTSVVLQAALEVHCHFGPGLLRSAYETALCHELSQRQVPFERHKPLSFHFRDVVFEDAAEVALLVNGELPIVCLSRNTVDFIEKARLRARLRQGNWRTGLILNFNVSEFRDGICRVTT